MVQFEEVKKLFGESVSYYLIAVDMDSNYSYANKRYNLIFEPIHGDLIGQHYSVTMHQEDQQTCKIVSQMAFQFPDKMFPATIRKHDGAGGYMVTRWEYKAMFDGEGKAAGVFCIGHDITEMVEIATELENTKYLHSHALRRPVANLVGLSKLLMEMELNSDAKDLARMIIQSAVDLDKELINASSNK
jgi:PAS domain S-box-containing protein